MNRHQRWYTVSYQVIHLFKLQVTCHAFPHYARPQNWQLSPSRLEQVIRDGTFFLFFKLRAGYESLAIHFLIAVELSTRRLQRWHTLSASNKQGYDDVQCVHVCMCAQVCEVIRDDTLFNNDMIFTCQFLNTWNFLKLVIEVGLITMLHTHVDTYTRIGNQVWAGSMKSSEMPYTFCNPYTQIWCLLVNFWIYSLFLKIFEIGDWGRTDPMLHTHVDTYIHTYVRKYCCFPYYILMCIHTCIHTQILLIQVVQISYY